MQKGDGVILQYLITFHLGFWYLLFDSFGLLLILFLDTY